MINLSALPPERKKKAKDHLEENWPELIDEIRKYTQAFGVVTVYYEEYKDVVDD